MYIRSYLIRAVAKASKARFLRFRLLRFRFLSSAFLLLLLSSLRLVFFLRLGLLFLGLLLLCRFVLLYGFRGYLAAPVTVASSTPTARYARYAPHDYGQEGKYSDDADLSPQHAASTSALVGWCLRSCCIATSGTSSL